MKTASLGVAGQDLTLMIVLIGVSARPSPTGEGMRESSVFWVMGGDDFEGQ
jgi:hypothetical protein